MTILTILNILAFLIGYIGLAIFVGKCIKFGSEQDHEVPDGGLQRDPPAIIFFRTHHRSAPVSKSGPKPRNFGRTT